MAEQKEIKKIRTQDDLNKLKIGDIVEIRNYGKMLYYATSMLDHTFLGRGRSKEIIELEISRRSLLPLEDGSSFAIASISDNYPRTFHNTMRYSLKDYILREAGL